MRPEESCPKCETCSAPMCPLDSENLKISSWYPDEEVCTNRDYFALNWIKNQKKIAKKTKELGKFFTLKMLERNCKIAKGIVGLDPEGDEELQAKKWFKLHPIKKEMTAIQKKIIVTRFKEYRKKGKK